MHRPINTIRYAFRYSSSKESDDAFLVWISFNDAANTSQFSSKVFGLFAARPYAF